MPARPCTNDHSKAPSRTLLSRRASAALAAILILIGVATAFTNSVVAEPSTAGQGASEISVQTVSNIHYVLDGDDDTDISTIEAVTFNLSRDVNIQASIYVSLDDAHWIQCVTDGSVAGHAASTSRPACNFTGAGVEVIEVEQFRIVSAD